MKLLLDKTEANYTAKTNEGLISMKETGSNNIMINTNKELVEDEGNP